MQHQEKKLRVETLAPVVKQLELIGAIPLSSSESIHYYAMQSGNDVTKMVEHSDRVSIHILDEVEGKYSLREDIALLDKASGEAWFKDKGIEEIGLVKMHHTDYKYKNGVVGLYTINDWLYSVILDYPEGQHESIAHELRLEDAEVITLPYNKYLEGLGKLESIRL